MVSSAARMGWCEPTMRHKVGLSPCQIRLRSPMSSLIAICACNFFEYAFFVAGVLEFVAAPFSIVAHKFFCCNVTFSIHATIVFVIVGLFVCCIGEIFCCNKVVLLHHFVVGGYCNRSRICCKLMNSLLWFTYLCCTVSNGQDISS